MVDEAQIRVIDDGENVTIIGGGVLDFTNSMKLDLALKHAALNADIVTIDFKAADFIDTAVIQYLAKAAMTMINMGKHLQVIVLKNSYPLQVFKISGFGRIMDIIVETDETENLQQE